MLKDAGIVAIADQSLDIGKRDVVGRYVVKTLYRLVVCRTLRWLMFTVLQLTDIICVKLSLSAEDVQEYCLKDGGAM